MVNNINTYKWLATDVEALTGLGSVDLRERRTRGLIDGYGRLHRRVWRYSLADMVALWIAGRIISATRVERRAAYVAGGQAAQGVVNRVAPEATETIPFGRERFVLARIDPEFDRILHIERTDDVAALPVPAPASLLIDLDEMARQLPAALVMKIHHEIRG